VARYRKRPLCVEATRWQHPGDHPRVGPYESRRLSPKWQCPTCQAPPAVHGWVDTAQGGLWVCPGDWIVTDESYDLVVLPDALFHQIYVPVEDLAMAYGSQNEATQSHSEALNQSGGENDKKMTAGKLRRWFSDAYKSQTEFRTEVVDNLKMLSGDQWPDELKAKLREQGMAPIVINRMLMPILFLAGVQRQTRQEPKLIAFEAGDTHSTEMMNALVHWVLDQNNADDLDSRVFLDKISVGLGWWKAYVDFTVKDLEGKICLHRRHPLTVFADPNWLDSGWEDAQYVMDAQWFSEAEASERWPEHEDLFKRQPGEWARTTEGDFSTHGMGELIGDSLSSERLFWDSRTKRVRVIEAWYKEKQEVTLAYNALTHETEDDPDKIEQLQQVMQTLPPDQQQNIVFIPRTLTVVRMAHFFTDTLLDDDVSPFDTPDPMFPIFPAQGYYFWGRPFGLADLMKDLQREKNKRRSKLIELVGRMPLSGFFNKSAGGADPKQIEEYGAGNGIVINYDTEIPQQIKPPDMPMALVRLEDKSDEEIKDVPNVHNELLGQATQKTISGRAIEARQRGGLISHEILFDSFRQEQANYVKFLIALIKQYMSPTKALRILGSLAHREPDSPTGQLMAQAQGMGQAPAPGMGQPLPLPGQPPGMMPGQPAVAPGPGMAPQPAVAPPPPGMAPAAPGMMPGQPGMAPAPGMAPPTPTEPGPDIMEMLGQSYDAEYDVVIASRPTEPSLAMQSWETLSEMAASGAQIPPKVLFEAAAKAGIMDEGQVSEILAFIQQQQAAAAQPQGPPPQPGGPPAPAPGQPPPPGPPPPQG
jgi:hypothetical protein